MPDCPHINHTYSCLISDHMPACLFLLCMIIKYCFLSESISLWESCGRRFQIDQSETLGSESGSFSLLSWCFADRHKSLNFTVLMKVVWVIIFFIFWLQLSLSAEALFAQKYLSRIFRTENHKLFFSFTISQSRDNKVKSNSCTEKPFHIANHFLLCLIATHN